MRTCGANHAEQFAADKQRAYEAVGQLATEKAISLLGPWHHRDKQGTEQLLAIVAEAADSGPEALDALLGVISLQK